jgi:ribonuclease BN (tRNA processing enzyme)
VGRQLVHAGFRLARLSHVFITHQHSDHNGDYGNLLHQAWLSGLTTPVDTYGPPPLVEMTRHFLALNAYDIAIRTRDEIRPPLEPLLRPHDITEPGLVYEDERVRVTAGLVHHPPVEPAFAYRFDSSRRSIVISGDTTPCDGLIQLARGADILVHEVLYEPAVDRMPQRIPNAARAREHLLACHTTLDQVGQIATAAEVGTLVLSHFAPADDTEITDDIWQAGAAAHFSGPVIVGHDLQEI